MLQRESEQLLSPMDQAPPVGLMAFIDPSLVPAFDVETMLLTDGRFEEVLRLAGEKKFTASTLEGISSIRERWITERSGVWDCFSGITEFAALSEEPGFADSIKQEEIARTEEQLDEALYGRPGEQGELWFFGRNVSRNPMEYLNKWLNNNLGHGAEGYALRQKITQTFSDWVEGHMQKVLDICTVAIKSTPEVGEGLSIPEVAKRVQRAFSNTYLSQFDNMVDQALNTSIADLKAMEPFEDEVHPKIKLGRRILVWATGQGEQAVTDLGARDRDALGNFFSIPRNLTALNSSVKKYAVRAEVTGQFDGAIGYQGFRKACVILTNQARKALLRATRPENADKILGQFEIEIEELLQATSSK